MGPITFCVYNAWLEETSVTCFSCTVQWTVQLTWTVQSGCTVHEQCKNCTVHVKNSEFKLV